MDNSFSIGKLKSSWRSKQIILEILNYPYKTEILNKKKTRVERCSLLARRTASSTQHINTLYYLLSSVLYYCRLINVIFSQMWIVNMYHKNIITDAGFKIYIIIHKFHQYSTLSNKYLFQSSMKICIECMWIDSGQAS